MIVWFCTKIKETVSKCSVNKVNWKATNGSQMPICKFKRIGNWQPGANLIQRILDNLRYIRNWQTAARCQFAHSSELETGNWQPDAYSILDGLRRLKLNTQPANGIQISIH